jgi:uncharacterized protein YqjF (DUF2071 family)
MMDENMQSSYDARSSAMVEIDRVSPTRRPLRRAIVRQKWRELLFVHWPVPPEVVRPRVPPELELDLFEGSAYLGLVPFTMAGVRPVGLPPIRGLSRFHEINLRTYVRVGNRDPGVWFFSLDAASSWAVRFARAFFHLPYHRAQMFLERELAGSTDLSTTRLYAGVRHWPGPLPASYAIRAAPTGVIQTAQTGTLEHFLVERYILYTLWRGCLYEGRVYHTPYPLQTGEILSLDETLLTASGFRRPTSAPLVHFATGVDVEVFALRRVS